CAIPWRRTVEGAGFERLGPVALGTVFLLLLCLVLLHYLASDVSAGVSSSDAASRLGFGRSPVVIRWLWLALLWIHCKPSRSSHGKTRPQSPLARGRRNAGDCISDFCGNSG